MGKQLLQWAVVAAVLALTLETAAASSLRARLEGALQAEGPILDVLPESSSDVGGPTQCAAHISVSLRPRMGVCPRAFLGRSPDMCSVSMSRDNVKGRECDSYADWLDGPVGVSKSLKLQSGSGDDCSVECPNIFWGFGAEKASPQSFKSTFPSHEYNVTVSLLGNTTYAVEFSADVDWGNCVSAVMGAGQGERYACTQGNIGNRGPVRRVFEIDERNTPDGIRMRLDEFLPNPPEFVDSTQGLGYFVNNATMGVMLDELWETDCKKPLPFVELGCGSDAVGESCPGALRGFGGDHTLIPAWLDLEVRVLPTGLEGAQLCF